MHIQIQIPNLGSPAEFSHSHKHCKRKATQQHLHRKLEYKENIRTITGKKRSNNKNLKSQSPVKMLMVYRPKLTTKTPPMLTTLSADALVGSMSVLGHTWNSIFDKAIYCSTRIEQSVNVKVFSWHLRERTEYVWWPKEDPVSPYSTIKLLADVFTETVLRIIFCYWDQISNLTLVLSFPFLSHHWL